MPGPAVRSAARLTVIDPNRSDRDDIALTRLLARPFDACRDRPWSHDTGQLNRRPARRILRHHAYGPHRKKQPILHLDAGYECQVQRLLGWIEPAALAEQPSICQPIAVGEQAICRADNLPGP